MYISTNGKSAHCPVNNVTGRGIIFPFVLLLEPSPKYAKAPHCGIDESNVSTGFSLYSELIPAGHRVPIKRGGVNLKKQKHPPCPTRGRGRVFNCFVGFLVPPLFEG